MSTLRTLLRPLLAAARTSPQLMRLAHELESLAAELRARAAALARDAERPEGQRLALRQTGRAPARFVRLEALPRSRRGAYRVTIGRAIWYELLAVEAAAGRPEPQRLDPQRTRDGVAFHVTREGGYAVHAKGMPKFTPSIIVIQRLGLEPGRYAARVEEGAILLGARLPEPDRTSP